MPKLAYIPSQLSKMARDRPHTTCRWKNLSIVDADEWYSKNKHEEKSRDEPTARKPDTNYKTANYTSAPKTTKSTLKVQTYISAWLFHRKNGFFMKNRRTGKLENPRFCSNKLILTSASFFMRGFFRCFSIVSLSNCSFFYLMVVG